MNAIRVYAGACTVTYTGATEMETVGRVLTIIKPDGTVLVHDESGYQPAAWLTRAASVNVTGTDPLELTATSGDQRLTVLGTAEGTLSSHRISPSGSAVGECPSCQARLLRAGSAIVCEDCLERWSLPSDATILEMTCPDCALPRMTVDRGATIQTCIDSSCQSLAAAVRKHVAGEWCCPECDRPFSVREEMGVVAGCAACGDWYPIPAGTDTGTCACGLPQFHTTRGVRCLDARCEREAATEPAP